MELTLKKNNANIYLSDKPVTFGGFVIRGKKTGKFLPIYLNYMLKHSIYRKQVQKIADILSTWDRAIELKESLIKEKEEQKKRLMQRLLTPKNHWEEKN